MKRFTISLLFLIGLLAPTRAANLSEKLRAISCDLSTLSLQSPTNVSGELKKLLDKADPDIVFLQGALDWETCERICKLHPRLNVVTCSAFPGQPITSIAPQVAILARDKAILSWVEEFSPGNAFAFAMLQAGQRKFAVFSIQSQSDDASDRVLAEIKRLQSFSKNAPDSFLIAGAPLSKTALAAAGFENIAADVTAEKKSAKSEFWTSNAGFLSRPRAFNVAGIPQPALISDFDSASSFSSKLAHQNALLFPGESPAPVQAIVQPQPLRIWPIAAAVAGTLLAIIIIALLLRPKPSMALAPLNENNMGQTRLDETSRSHLLTWFKSIFMQRLVSERQQMISEQSEATRRTLAIEEKIGKLQSDLQERIAGYESRIARLEGELASTAFENRDLIKNQIELLKQQVAKAKEEEVVFRN